MSAASERLGRDLLYNSSFIPPVRADLRAVLDERRTLRDALNRFGQHRGGCEHIDNNRDGLCDCGFVDALEKANGP